jgi:hypothetical protein
MNEARTNRSQPGDGMEAPRSSSRDYTNTQDGALLDHENQMQHDRLSPSALPTTCGSNLGEHYGAISHPLLDHENETRGIQRQRSLTLASNSLQPIRHDDTPAEALLHREKPLTTVLGWPSSPKPIKTPIYINVLNTMFDVLLCTCSVTFLAFALVVNVHNQDLIAEYPRLTTTLLNATKYVPSPQTSLKKLKLTSDRAQPFSPSFSPQSLAVRHTLFYSGVLRKASALAYWTHLLVVHHSLVL